MQDDLIYAISHDLRAPLLNFQGFLRRLSSACQLLETQTEGWNITGEQRRLYRELLEDKVAFSLEVLERNARRMDRLLTALLELSRAGREPLQFERIQAGEAAREVAGAWRASAAEKKAAVRIEPMPAVWGDRERLARIFDSLLSNALKFLCPGRPGEIVMGGREEQGEVILWIRDNGIGVKPEDQPRIFLPFGRLREVESDGEGVGLAIASKLVAQLGGRLWVESNHGAGSTFYVGLPSGPRMNANERE